MIIFWNNIHHGLLLKSSFQVTELVLNNGISKKPPLVWWIFRTLHTNKILNSYHCSVEFFRYGCIEFRFQKKYSNIVRYKIKGYILLYHLFSWHIIVLWAKNLHHSYYEMDNRMQKTKYIQFFTGFLAFTFCSTNY